MPSNRPKLSRRPSGASIREIPLEEAQAIVAEALGKNLFGSSDINEDIKQKAVKLLLALINMTFGEVILFSVLSRFTDGRNSNKTRQALQLMVTTSISGFCAFLLTQRLYGTDASETSRRDRTTSGIAIFAVLMLVSANILFRVARALWYGCRSIRQQIDKIANIISENQGSDTFYTAIYNDKFTNFTLVPDNFTKHVLCDYTRRSADDRQAAIFLTELRIEQLKSMSQATNIEKMLIKLISWQLGVLFDTNPNKNKDEIAKYLRRSWNLLFCPMFRDTDDIIKREPFKPTRVLDNFVEQTTQEFPISQKALAKLPVASFARIFSPVPLTLPVMLDPPFEMIVVIRDTHKIEERDIYNAYRELYNNFLSINPPTDAEIQPENAPWLIIFAALETLLSAKQADQSQQITAQSLAGEGGNHTAAPQEQKDDEQKEADASNLYSYDEMTHYTSMAKLFKVANREVDTTGHQTEVALQCTSNSQNLV